MTKRSGKVISLFVGMLVLASVSLVFAAKPVTYDRTKVFIYNRIKDGWKLVENVTRPAEVSIKDLKLISFHRDGESFVGGEEMRSRAIHMEGNFGQATADYLLVHKSEIPKEFRNYVLMFPGTVWQDPNGVLCMPCLKWYGVQWSQGVCLLNAYWGRTTRLLSLHK